MGLADSTLGLLDYVWPRIRGRLDGMTDDEYLWEPVSGCWSVRPGPSGKWEAEREDPSPVPPPVTSIAWRTWHIASECLGGFTELLFGQHPLTWGHRSGARHRRWRCGRWTPLGLASLLRVIASTTPRWRRSSGPVSDRTGSPTRRTPCCTSRMKSFTTGRKYPSSEISMPLQDPTMHAADAV